MICVKIHYILSKFGVYLSRSNVIHPAEYVTQVGPSGRYPTSVGFTSSSDLLFTSICNQESPKPFSIAISTRMDHPIVLRFMGQRWRTITNHRRWFSLDAAVPLKDSAAEPVAYWINYTENPQRPSVSHRRGRCLPHCRRFIRELCCIPSTKILTLNSE